MELLNNLLVLPAVSGIALFIIGIIFYNFPPKQINRVYGYRTATSMKSKDSWDFAQKYSSRRMIQGGVVLLLTSLIGLTGEISDGLEKGIGLGMILLFVAYIVMSTESALKAKFE